MSDDGHDAATASVCHDIAGDVDVEYVLGPQRGLGANRNRALSAVTGELVVFLDDDCLLMPGFMEAALTRLRAAEERHGAGRVIVSGRELNRGHLISAADQTFLGHQCKRYASDEELRSIVINAAVFPARLFSELQFDPQLVYGYEEVDLASRAAAAGYVIVHCEDAINDHRPSPRSRDGYSRHVEASRLHVTLRRYLFTERSPLRAVAFVVVAPVHLLASSVKRAGAAGLREAVTTLLLAAGMLWRAQGTAPPGRADSRADAQRVD